MLPILSSIRPRIVSASVIVIFIACALPAGFPPVTVRAQGERAASSKEKAQPKKKGLAPVRQEEAPDGSRVTITYNTPLSDYSAYRQGNRFIVVIPKADAPRVRANLRGRGFDGVQVERRGDDAVLSFRIRPGTRARVDQQFNRLDVVFSAPEQPASNIGQTAAAPSQPSVGAASQNRQARAATPPTPLANHNAMADTTARPNTVRPGAETTEATASTAAQVGPAVVMAAQSPAPSNGSSATPTSSRADERGTTQPVPGISPTASPTSLSIVTARYWLPLLLALLLLLSAWAVIVSRRRVARHKSVAPLESPPELTPRTEVTEIAPVIEQAVRTESAVMMPAMADVALAEDEAWQGATGEASLGQSPETDRETLELESVETAAPEGDGPTAATAVVAMSAARPVEPPPAPPAPDVSGIPANILRYLGSEDANERSAGVLGLADILSDEAFGRIGAAFDDPSQQVRDAAARALFNVSADRAASFKRLMRAASPERRRRVGEAIASSGMAGEAISDLSSESGERAYDALLVLSLMAKSGEVQSLVETIEEHPSTEVRLALVKLLALSGRQEILESFRYLSTRDSLPIAVRSSIMEAIYQLNNPQPLPLQTT